MGNNAEVLAEEVLAALDSVEALESWMRHRVDGSVDATTLCETVRLVTATLLGADPPNTSQWEQLAIAMAAHSSRPDGKHAYDGAQAAISKLSEMIYADSFRHAAAESLVTLGSALTLMLTAQRQLRQRVEATTRALCDRFPELLPDMAQRCQDLWQRHGQVSGANGLFVWDERRDEWRLSQDFKPYRSAS